MNSEGPVCWQGVAASPGGQLSCTCRTDPPEFDIIFPADVSIEFSTTVAPATTTDNAGYYYYTLTNIGTELISVNSSGGGIGGDGGDGDVGGGGDDGGGSGVTFRPITVSPTDQDGNSSHLWIESHEGSLKLLIWAFLALLCIVVFLILIIFCFVKRRRKRSPVNNYRPETEGCETNEQPCEVKTTVPTSTTNHNNFQLVQLDESPIHRTFMNDTRLTNSHGAPSGSANPSAAAGYPMMRAVKAKIVGSGISPIRTIRPVGRQDSTAPLVEHHDDDDVVLFRDGWTDFGDDHAHHSLPFTPQFGVDHDIKRNSSPQRQPAEINPSWRLSEVPILTPLGEPGDRTSKEVPTKLEMLPSRLFPESSVLETTPCRKKTNKRPDSSTPLFDGDSVSSAEMDNH